MSASIFESIPDKTLFRFIKMVMEATNFEALLSSQDRELMEGIEDAESALGVRGDDITIDCDYIYNVWKLNEDLFEEDRLTGNLDRPTFKKVEFDWYSWETQWVKLTYRHQVETYGTDKNDIYSYIYGMSSEGDMSYWDGKLIDTNNYDSETTDESIDDSSITIL
jgi:hypothetical protein